MPAPVSRAVGRHVGRVNQPTLALLALRHLPSPSIPKRADQGGKIVSRPLRRSLLIRWSESSPLHPQRAPTYT
jgi:hypothetical protein